MICFSNYFELCFIMIFKIGDRYPHNSKVIHWNFRYFANINSIKIIIFWIFFRNIMLRQNQFFMSFYCIQISKPHCIAKTSPFLSIFINPISCFAWRCVSWNFKWHISEFVTNPCFIFFDVRKYFFVSYSILISNY